MSHLTSYPSIEVTEPTYSFSHKDHTVRSITVKFEFSSISREEALLFLLEAARILLPGGNLSVHSINPSYELEHGIGQKYFLPPLPSNLFDGYENYCRLALPLEGWYNNKNSQLMANYVFVYYRAIYDAFFNDYLLAMRTMRIFVTEIDVPDTVKNYNDYLRYWLTTRTPWNLKERRWISQEKEETKEDLFTFFYHGKYYESPTPTYGSHFCGASVEGEE